MKDEPQLIDLFAMFALLKLDWHRGFDDKNAMDAYQIAEAMMKARKFYSEGENSERAV